MTAGNSRVVAFGIINIQCGPSIGLFSRGCQGRREPANGRRLRQSRNRDTLRPQSPKAITTAYNPIADFVIRCQKYRASMRRLGDVTVAPGRIAPPWRQHAYLGTIRWTSELRRPSSDWV